LIGTDHSVRLGGADPVVAASVFKVAVALAALEAGEDGRIDLSAPVTLSPDQRTPGPTGFSTFDHAVTAALGDLVAVMLSISDNAATDAVLGVVGLEAVNDLVHALGCRDTLIVGDLRSMLDGIGDDMGFRSWDELVAAQEGALGEAARVQGTDLERLRLVGALDADRTTRTTADDMVRLLVAIWEDRAGSPATCARLRSMLGAQVNRDRLARGFDRPVAVAAKSGSMLGVVRNEVGVVGLSDGVCVALAVMTTAETPYVGERAINGAIADVARMVVAELLGRR